MADKKILTEEDEALLADLGIEVEVKKHTTYTSREERIIAGFEEIKEFVQENGRLPEHGENKEIFERLFAIRLDQIRGNEESKTLLKNLDDQGLLAGSYQPILDETEDLNDDELLVQLGLYENEENSITNLKHVRSQAEKKAAEEIANRAICEDFEHFKPFFDEVKKDISLKYRTTIRFRKDAGFTKTTIKKGQFLIIVGQIAYIENKGETIKAPNGEDDARLRVIYDNGTESNILLRSLIRAMYKDNTSRFITDPNSGPLFSGESSEDDLDSGTIYVLRSLSEHPIVKANRNLVHKIGVTGGDVKKRIANAKNDPTFLLAEVKIIATYRLANINRIKLEKIIHKFFSKSKLEVEISDRFGRPVRAQEWFLMPLFIIDEMVEKIKDGTISDFYYDPSSVKFLRR